MPAFFKHLFGSDTSVSLRLRLLISAVAIAGMAVLSIASEVSYSSRPLQVRELAGRQVSMEKLADIFLGMDQIALENHYRRIWTFNGIIFLGALLLVVSLKDGGKK